MESGSGPRDPSSDNPQSPAPGGPQSPSPGSQPAPPMAPPVPSSPESPAGPQSPTGPAYGGPVPPGGWQQPMPQGPGPCGFAPGPLAGWGARFGAAILDALIITVPALIILSVLGLGALGASSSDSDTGIVAAVVGLIVTVAVITVISFLYAPLLMMRDGERNGQTLGKQVLSIRVVRHDGQQIGFGYAALREVAVKNFGVGIASSFTFGIATLLNYLWPLWDDQNRAVHDMIVNSRVIRTA